MRVLHVATELFPLLKLGGLGDVIAALPLEQNRQGTDARILLPGLPACLDGLDGLQAQAGWRGEGRLLRGRAPSGLEVYLLDLPDSFGHLGNPYQEDPEAPRRFAAFARAAATLGVDGDGRGWKPEILHLHDWPAALAAAYLTGVEGPRSATVLTVHNAGYQGLFPAEAFGDLGLPASAFSPEGLEFHGQFSLLKAGVLYADRLTTVSPTYALELQTPAGGRGLHGLFARRSGDLAGILNGVDREVWNPASDPALEARYDATRPEARARNKAALQAEAGLPVDPATPLFAVMRRFDPMKGLDLLLENAPLLAGLDAQLRVLGRGDAELEAEFRRLAEADPAHVSWTGRHDEALAHRILGGADFVVMPSRAEPCGLTQLYALRYGAVPLVRRTGGLADTVQDGAAATGLLFHEAAPEALGRALVRACDLFRREPAALKAIQARGMAQVFDWGEPARRYEALYGALYGALVPG
jgi:starch synthase